MEGSLLRSNFWSIKASLFLWILCLIFICLNCQSSQSTTSSDNDTIQKYAASTRLFVQSLAQNEGEVSTEMKEKYGILVENNLTFVKSTIKIEPTETSEQSLESCGAKVQSQLGSIWTLLIPVDRISEVARINEITYIEIDSISETLK